MASGEAPSSASIHLDPSPSLNAEQLSPQAVPSPENQASSSSAALQPQRTHDGATSQQPSRNPSARSSLSAPSPISSVDTPNGNESSHSNNGHAPSLSQAVSESMDVEQIHSGSERSSSPTSSADQKLKRQSERSYLNQLQMEYGEVRRSGRARVQTKYEESDAEDKDSDSESDAVKKPGLKRRTVRKGPVSKFASKSATATGTNTPLSDSDSDTYGGNRGRVARKQERAKRIHHLATESATGTPDREFRFTNRSAAKAINYNEDDDDEDLLEDDPDGYGPDAWVGGPDDQGPAIDVIMDHHQIDDTPPEPLQPESFQYLVKFQNNAFYHASWESADYLATLKGAKKLQNYFKKIVARMFELENKKDESVEAFEELEEFQIEHNKALERYEDYKQIERVVDKRAADDGNTEYYVKWYKLEYNQCTWESDELVSELVQSEIDRFLDKLNRSYASDKKQSNRQTRSPWVPFYQQPSYIKNVELRDFQIRGVNFLANNWCQGRSSILADEMGLGKTIQTVTFLAWLRHDRRQQGPMLLVAPLSTLDNWARTFKEWSPDTHYVVYTGNAESRGIIREKELMEDDDPRRIKFNVLITTAEYINLDAGLLSQFRWQFLAVDEAHSRLKNSKSQLYINLTAMAIPESLLITGTPIQNTIKELKALVDILEPGQQIIPEGIDLDTEEGKEEIMGLIENFNPHILRRTKEEVEKDLPQKTEKILRVSLAKIQQELYQNIVLRNYSALNQGGTGQHQSLLNIVMELRKASNHPCLFPNSADQIFAGKYTKEAQLNASIHTSGKLILLHKLLPKLLAEGHRVLIFSQMVKMLNLLGDFLRGCGIKFQRVDGSVPPGPRQKAIDLFNAPESEENCFILSTRAGGLGINLYTADTVILFDSDYNPHADAQAIARAHRIGQKNFVTVYRLVTADTIEEDIIEKARDKQLLDYVISQGVTEKADRAKNLVKVPDSKAAAETINNLLRTRGQKIFQPGDNQRELEEMDINAVLDNAEEYKAEVGNITHDGGEEFLKKFEYTDVKVDVDWDDFVPKDRLQEIREEEKRRKDEEFLATLIEEYGPRKRKQAYHDPVEADDRPSKKARPAKVGRKASKLEASREDSDVEEADPSRPLEEKETRNLIRAYERYGSLEDRQEELLHDAKLENRDLEVVKSTLQDIIQISKDKLQEERDRISALESEQSKTLTKKDKKAVLFDYNGVKKLNAETLLERPKEMHALRDALANVANVKAFRIPDASKYPSYTCAWGAKEDGMLCVGIHRHGYGAWAAIRDDPELDLEDKFFLEEHQVAHKKERQEADEHKDKNIRSPGAVHLVRRANYLLSVLRDKATALERGNDSEAAVIKKRAKSSHHDRHGSDKIRRTSNHTTGSSPRGSKTSFNDDINDTREKSRRISDASATNLPLSNDPTSAKHLKKGTESKSSHANDIGDRASLHPLSAHHRRSHSNSKTPRSSDRISPAPTSNAKLVVDRDRSESKAVAVKNGVNTSVIKDSKDNKDKVKGEHSHRDAAMEGFLGEIYEPLRALRKGNSDGASQVDRVKVIKAFMKAIKTFVETQVVKRGEDFESKFWDYIGRHYWPFGSKEDSQTGVRLRRTFQKLSQDTKPEETAASAAQTKS